MIDTVIFDIGKVLVDYDWHRYLFELFEDPNTAAAIEDAAFGHGQWREMDRGVWNRQELLDAFLSHAPGYRKEIEYFMDHQAGVLTQQPYAKRWIFDLKKRGYRVLFLSNWSEYLMLHTEAVLDFLPLMDGGVFSYRVKAVKPDRKIYECLISRYDLIPENCVFIDDKPKNVLAAETVGMAGICYQTYEQACGELEQMLGKQETVEPCLWKACPDVYEKID